MQDRFQLSYALFQNIFDKPAFDVYKYTQMDSRKIIKMLEKGGWYKADQSGSHIQLRHPTKNGRVTVPHPKKDIPIGTLRSIERQSGIKFK